MKGGQILLAALILCAAATGCSKPEEGTTYVPPPNIQPAKKGTIYMSNNAYYGMDFYIGQDFIRFIDGGTYYKKEVPPGLYHVHAIQKEGIKKGEKPAEAGLSVTVTADHMVIVSLP